MINAGATVALKAANALGYFGNNWMRTITLNGGTLRTDVSGDNGWGTTINLTRGTLSAGVANGYFSMGNTPVFNVTGDTAASVISANLTVRDNDGVFEIKQTFKPERMAICIKSAEIVIEGGGSGATVALKSADETHVPQIKRVGAN